MTEATLICTVYNEEESIGELLDSIVEQSEKPEQAVFVDGGSQDSTPDVIEEYAEQHPWIDLIVEQGANISEGRNIAVENAEHDNIIGTDGGCILDENYVKEMKKAFDDGEYIIGMWDYRADSLFEKVQGRIVCSAHTVEELKKGNRGPSSRAVGFTKEVWESVGGYPEELYTGEDSKYNSEILSQGYEPVIAENALVYWKMRPTWKALWKQFKTYGEGDAKGGNLFTHPSQKLGVSKNVWLYSSALVPDVSAGAAIASAFLAPQLVPLFVAPVLAGLLVPFAYYIGPLKETLSEDGPKALLIGLGISQVKYWAWYYGFNIQLLKKPSLVVHQFSEWRRLR